MRHVWGFDPYTKILEQYSVSAEQIKQILIIVAERADAACKELLYDIARGYS